MILTRPRATKIALAAFLAYAVLLWLNISFLLPPWLTFLTTVAGVLCILIMVTCCIKIFEQSRSSYDKEFGHDR